MDTHLLDIIIQYRYLILIPLSFIEGPIVAFFAGTLAAAGYFNIFALAAFFLVRDMLVDLGCYMFGAWGANTSWVHRALKKIGVKEDHLADVHRLWEHHPGKTMFVSKLSYGVAASFIIVAGLVRAPLKKFLIYGFLIALLHYGAMLLLGYFLGASFGGNIAAVLEKIPYVLLVLSILALAYYFFHRYMHKRVVALEEDINQGRTD